MSSSSRGAYWPRAGQTAQDKTVQDRFCLPVAVALAAVAISSAIVVTSVAS